MLDHLRLWSRLSKPTKELLRLNRGFKSGWRNRGPVVISLFPPFVWFNIHPIMTPKPTPELIKNKVLSTSPLLSFYFHYHFFIFRHFTPLFNRLEPAARGALGPVNQTENLWRSQVSCIHNGTRIATTVQRSIRLPWLPIISSLPPTVRGCRSSNSVGLHHQANMERFTLTPRDNLWPRRSGECNAVPSLLWQCWRGKQPASIRLSMMTSTTAWNAWGEVLC